MKLLFLLLLTSCVTPDEKPSNRLMGLEARVSQLSMKLEALQNKVDDIGTDVELMKASPENGK